ncbi:MAG: hypothetical protein LUI39_05340 [Lachnospiraceae bacterium]|nr:hypothetical protein [Lachnospiraceae bacterium]
MFQNPSFFENPTDVQDEKKKSFLDYFSDQMNATEIEDLENYNPAESDPEMVTGEPEKSMEYWEYQGNTNRCSIYSQKFIIEELTGQELDIEEVVEVAIDNGWFTEEGGTSLMNISKLLEYYGVDCEMSQGNTLEDIEECLENGGLVEVAIDADEIWYGENDFFFTPSDGPNHAVEVIGIDRTDPDNPVVILNDSGNPNGCAVEIPLDTFMDAWEDSNYQMVAAQ